MAAKIDPTLAKNLIKEFKQQNATPEGPGLLTPDNQLLNGYFIDRESLEALLSNPNVAGISLNFAKHPNYVGLPGNVFTLVFAGAEPNTAADAATPYINTGDIYDFAAPCPPYCTDLG